MRSNCLTQSLVIFANFVFRLKVIAFLYRTTHSPTVVLHIMEKEIKICDECESEYFAASSKMMKLCPDCSHFLYDYENCNHIFENDRCVNCHWNGKSSKYILSKKEK
jgi:predicted RNA-binding Zn-ribbon protein involved in translation (DUF1610 family)|tara:strand:+ start:764 stop:1084 length:321 start_codon:yes stop_codon:yes gene_type:complete